MELAHDGAHHGDGVDLGEVGHVWISFGLWVKGGAIISIFIKIGPRVVELAHDGAHYGKSAVLAKVGHIWASFGLWTKGKAKTSFFSKLAQELLN